MSYALIREAFFDLLVAVEGVGKVHRFWRQTEFWDEFYAKHVKGNRVNSWEISRISIAEQLDSVQGAAGAEPVFRDTHGIVFRSHMQVNDSISSELFFQDTLDKAVTKIRENTRISGTVLIPAELQIPVIGHAMFGGVLCHFAQGTYAAQERFGG